MIRMTLLDSILLSLIPTISMLVGGLILQNRDIHVLIVSAIQFITSGILTASISSELVPLIHDISWYIILSGYLFGMVLLFTIKYFCDKFSEQEPNDIEFIYNDIESNYLTSIRQRIMPYIYEYSLFENMPWGIVIAAAIDSFIDGFLIGATTTAGSGNIIISIALAIEMLFLGMTIASKLRKNNIDKRIVLTIIFGLPLTIILGTIVGYYISGLSTIIFQLIISFSIAGLLYLVIVELLKDAYENMECSESQLTNIFISSGFFIGFILILILD